jgi:uncharacterized protein YebE (UPF0316 family)
MYSLETIFLFIFIFTILFVTRITFRFINALMKNPPEQFVLSGRELVFFGLSLSYILTYLIKI